jgi:PIN domain nuclease of toxin-antitoxin system
MIVEPLYVTDTNALYWYLSGDKKLSRAAFGVFQAARQGETQIVVSAMVIAELYWVNRKWQGIY